jgi:hypothetical protein
LTTGAGLVTGGTVVLCSPASTGEPVGPATKTLGGSGASGVVSIVRGTVVGGCKVGSINTRRVVATVGATVLAAGCGGCSLSVCGGSHIGTGWGRWSAAICMSGARNAIATKPVCSATEAATVHGLRVWALVLTKVCSNTMSPFRWGRLRVQSGSSFVRPRISPSKIRCNSGGLLLPVAFEERETGNIPAGSGRRDGGTEPGSFGRQTEDHGGQTARCSG